MNYTGHIHKIVVLQSPDYPDQKAIKLKLQKPLDDWQKNLSFLFGRIPKKFKFLAELSDDEWALSLNGTIVGKDDSDKFGEIISQIPPQPIIDIVLLKVRWKITIC